MFDAEHIVVVHIVASLQRGRNVAMHVANLVRCPLLSDPRKGLVTELVLTVSSGHDDSVQTICRGFGRVVVHRRHVDVVGGRANKFTQKCLF